MSDATHITTVEPESRKTPQAIIYLWCLIPLGIIGALITLGLIVWIYQSIRDANREAEQLDGKILSSMSSITLIVEHVEADFRAVFDGESQYFEGDDPIALLEREIDTLQSTVSKAVSDVDHAQRVNTDELARMRDASTRWRQREEECLEKRRMAWSATEAAIGGLRAQMDSLLGRRRIQSILVAKKIKNNESEDRDQLVDTFLEESKIGSMLSMSKTELSDLEIVCNRLANEPEIDLLDSILKNEIVPRVDRLDQQMDEFHDAEVRESFDQVKRSIFGPEYLQGTPTQAQLTQANELGLYYATGMQLRNEIEGDRLRAEVQSALFSMKTQIDRQVESAKSMRSMVAEVASKSLRTGGMTIVLAGLIIGIAYGLLAYKIAYSVQCFVRDLHESHEALREANVQAVQANQELQDSIHERERLQNQLLEAQKLESIGQLAAGIAHEINTPAQYVGDNTRFLRNEFQGIMKLIDSCACFLNHENDQLSWEERSTQIRETLDDLDFEFIRDEIPQAIDQSIEGIDRITHIVKAMKEFSHPGSAHKEPADINAAIKSTSVVCSNRWKYAADIEFDFDSTLGPVPCLLGEFNQVVLNMIVNAADAIESHHAGSGEKGQICVSTRKRDQFVQICIKDNGGGMPESVRAKIFDPFFTTKVVGKGTGQGLAISRDVIVNKHGGKVVCETEEGVGTKFIIELPLGQFVDNEQSIDHLAA